MTVRIRAMMGMVGVALLGGLMLLPTGCQPSLFAEKDNRAQKLKYFSDSEPVVGQRERRQQNDATGFGMTNGPASQ